jgi:type VI secretion system protein ImpG
MSTARYFQDELDSLRRSGEEFSRFFPKLTSYLSSRSTDPDVERLLEGFAFLTARLREKLDDQLPEVTQSLLALLWPNYLRPVPAMTIMQLSPVTGAISQRQIVPAAAEIESVPSDGTVCRFRTCHDVAIDPLAVAEVRHDVSKDASVIRLRITTTSGESLEQVAAEDLTLWLGGSDYSAMTLNLWLHRYLKRIVVRTISGAEISLGPEALRQAGLADGERVLPYPHNSFSGYRLLQEYYALPRKFCAVQLIDLPLSHAGQQDERFELVFEFSRSLPPDVRVDGGSFLLNCVPAINLFDHDGEPILMSGRRSEYPVVPSRRNAGEIEVYSIERVTGWRPSSSRISEPERRDGISREYKRFESFSHEVERLDRREAVYFHERVRQSISGERLDRLISFVREDETVAAHESETVSLNLVCTNGTAPMALAAGDICIPTANTPNFVRPTNITRPTSPVYPLIDGSLQWQLISALSLNYQSLQSPEALCSILRVFDFGARTDRQRERETQQRLSGIEAIRSEPIDRLFRGRPVRGMRSTIDMRESRFGSEGEMFLFATILAEFFSLYSTINSFHELTVRGLETGEEYRWSPRIGTQPLI